MPYIQVTVECALKRAIISTVFHAMLMQMRTGRACWDKSPHMVLYLTCMHTAVYPEFPCSLTQENARE